MERVSEHSWGIIPLRKNEEGRWQVFLVQHRAGHWSMPKGHPEVGETPLETAKRELFEETGLRVEEILTNGPFEEHYMFRHAGRLIDKTVSYFLARVSGRESIDFDELSSAKWVDLDEAEQAFTFKEGKKIITDAKKFLSLFDK
jgi:8-oxo-dGTP pyrophosphatase MutT (NUDIX family)